MTKDLRLVPEGFCLVLHPSDDPSHHAGIVPVSVVVQGAAFPSGAVVARPTFRVKAFTFYSVRRVAAFVDFVPTGDDLPGRCFHRCAR